MYNNKNFVLVSGEKLTIRKPKVEDAAEMIEYLNIVGGESDNLLFGEGEFHFTVEQEIRMIENLEKEENKLMVIGVIDDEICSIGMVSTNGRERIAHNGDISISVKKKFWRKGIGQAIMGELIDFGVENETIRNLTLGVKEDNIGAINMYENFGFVKVGRYTDYFNIDGKYFDKIIMEMEA